MITVKKYIAELDAEMAQTEKRIRLGNAALVSREFKGDISYLKVVQDNLDNAIKYKKIIHDEIVGMIDYEDKYGGDRKTVDYGRQRYLPEYLKGNGHYYDVDDGDGLEYTGANQRDFEFW